MIYLLHVDASKETLTLKGDEYRYIVKARRHGLGDVLSIRSEKNIEILYSYSISEIGSRDATLTLLSKEDKPVRPKKHLHVGWCVIDFNSIDKVLPQLNEMGLSKITFITCERSQKSFKIDYKRIQRVLKTSNMQCGRTDTIEFSTCKGVDEFVEMYPSCTVLDFNDEILDTTENIETVLVGCEGGFSPKEKEIISTCKVRRLDSALVLRSESAVCAVVGKILL